MKSCVAPVVGGRDRAAAGIARLLGAPDQSPASVNRSGTKRRRPLYESLSGPVRDWLDWGEAVMDESLLGRAAAAEAGRLKNLRILVLDEQEITRRVLAVFL